MPARAWGFKSPSDTLQLHAVERGRKFDLLTAVNPAIANGQPEGLVKSTPVGLLDDFEQFWQVVKHRQGLEYLVKGERLRGRRRQCQHRLGGGLLSLGRRDPGGD